MPEFCDVALPVPLDMTFTYRIGVENTLDPVVGGRVLVPFRTERLSGIVTALHDNAPSMAAKSIYSVIDDAPVLSEQLLQLGRWIAQYYVAPIGEVLRTMLPLAAEVRRRWAYRTTALGEQRLFESAQRGSSKLSKLEIDDQMIEYAVLNHLSSGEQVLEGTLRSATGASRELLRGLMRKRWIVREDVTAIRDARRVIHYVVLDAEVAKDLRTSKLNANQKAIVEFLQQTEGRAALDMVRELAVPRTTLNTLVKRGLHPEARLAPLDDPFAFAELQSFMSYLCATVHVAHAHRGRGYRWTDDAAAIEAMKKKVPETVGACFDLIERKMFRGPWVMGEAYTVADPYLFTIARWVEGDGVDPHAFPRVLDHRERMAGRPAVQRALKSEGLA